MDDKPKTTRWVLPALILGAQLPLVLQHFHHLWIDPQYQCFPLVIGAALMFYLLRREITQENCERYIVGQVLFLSAGIATFVGAVVLNSPWVATAGAILSCGYFFLRASGPYSVRGMLAAWALLWLLLPLPMGYGESLRQFMQANSSYLSSRILDFMSVNHLMYGNVLMAHGERYFVDEACSGMSSLIAILAIVGIYVIAMRRSITASIGLLVMSVIGCFAMNSVRITLVILLDPMTSVDLSTGWGHETIGLTVFAATLLLLFSADGLFVFTTAPIFVPHVFERLEDRNLLVRCWNWCFVTRYSKDTNDYRTGFIVRTLPRCVPAFGILFAVVSLFGQFAGFSAYDGITDLQDGSAVETARELREDSLDVAALSPQYRLHSFCEESRGGQASAGEHSRVWQINAPMGRMTVSLDFPFVKFHDLTVCYKGQGWRVISDRRIDTNPQTSAPAAAFHEVQMERAPGELAYLYYGLFNSQTTDGGDGLSSRLKTRSKLTTEPLLQAQCLVETPEDLTREERHELMNHFIKTRGQLCQQVYGSRL